MLQHTSTPAVRRFYALFYQWSQLQRNSHQLATVYNTSTNAYHHQQPAATYSTSQSTLVQEKEEKSINIHKNSQSYSTVSKNVGREGGDASNVSVQSNYQLVYGAEFWLPFLIYQSQLFKNIELDIRKRSDVGKLNIIQRPGCSRMSSDDPNKIMLVHVAGTYEGVQATKKLLESRLLPALTEQFQLPSRIWKTQDLGRGRERWNYALVDGDRASASTNGSRTQSDALSLPSDIREIDNYSTRLLKRFPKEDAKSSTRSSPFGPQIRKVQMQPSNDSSTQDLKVADQVKSVCRSLTYPVVVITTQDRQHDRLVPAEELCRGVTVSSFTTVAMNPRPFITFNLRSDSRTLQAIKKTQLVMIHVLAATPAGARLASVFTKPRADPAEPFLTGELGRVEVAANNPPKLSGVWDEDASNGNAVIARIKCRVKPGMMMEVGDHTACYGMVTKVEAVNEIGESMELDTKSHMHALSYGEREYRVMGEGIKEKPSSQPLTERKTSLSSTAEQPEKSLEQLNLESAVEEYFSEISKPSVNDVVDDGEQYKATNDSVGVLAGIESGTSEIPTIEQSPALDEEPNLCTQASISPDPAYIPTKPHNSPGGWGLPPSMQTRTYSTISSLGHRLSVLGTPRFTLNPQRRSYTLTSAIGVAQQPSTASSTQLKQKISSFFPQLSFGPNSPSLKKALPSFDTYRPSDGTTSASDDYLIRDGTRSRRMRRLRTLHTTIDKATAQLNEENGLLDTADRTRLETTIHDAQREITRTIAVRAADELASLLDNGSAGLGDFDPNAAPDLEADTTHLSEWMLEKYRVLEEQIEKGLAVLMEEAKELRDDLDNGRVKRDEFEEKKARLARDHELLDTQSVRLKSLIEEDQDFEDDF